MTNRDVLDDPMTIVEALTTLPHRGATTKLESKAADIIEKLLKNTGAAVKRQSFRTPKSYIWEVWWMVGGIALGLLLASIIPWIGFTITLCFVGASLPYFDWRRSPISWLPPWSNSENVIGKKADNDTADNQERKKLVLMAHYDSAPISLLYLPSMVKTFRQSLLINIGLMIFAVFIVLLETLGMGRPFVSWIRIILAAYFLIQGLFTSFDFIRYGFTNGAADNASGVAVAITLAERLWKNPVSNWDVEVVLTSAEENGMVGSRAYYHAHREKLVPERTVVLNFDNLGAGNLKIITKTGSITNVIYDNALVDSAKEITQINSTFKSVETGEWHTGDFDSICFNRAGIPSLTLAAIDDAGQIPYLHRPDDTLENIDKDLPGFAVDFAEAVVRHLASK